MNDRETILIYQMGKVASQTIERSVRAIKPDARVVRSHFLSLRQYDELLAGDTGDVTLEFRASVFQQRQEASAMADWLRARGQERLIVISGCREPVGHCVAAAFQNIGQLLPRYLEDSPPDSVRQLRDLIVAAWEARQRGDGAVGARGRLLHHILGITPTWFEDELRGVLGVDVFARPYEPGTGPLLFQHDGMEVFVYRLEDGGTALGDGLSRLFGIDSVEVLDANRSADKDYHELYSAFQRTVGFPSDFLNGLYASRYTRHFWLFTDLSTAI